MKALVTGATGLLGSHIVDKLLERGDEVRALARPSSDIAYLQEREVAVVYGDVRDPESLRMAAEGVEMVYHAAAIVSDWGPWRDFAETTVTGTENVLEAAMAAGVQRFLHVSTDSVYPHRLKMRGQVLTEDSPLEERPPRWDYYQRSKLEAARIALGYHRSGRIQVSAVRPGLILGERDRSIMPGLVSYLRGPGAVYVGRGHNRLPCVYAGEVAEACILAATQEVASGKAYNVASAEIVTQRDLFGAVAEAMGMAPPKRSVPFRLVYLMGAISETLGRLRNRRDRPTMTRMSTLLVAYDYVLDSSRAKRELGWKAEVPVREAIRLSVDWLRERQHQPVGG